MNEANSSKSTIIDLLNITFGGKTNIPLTYRNEDIPKTSDEFFFAYTDYKWNGNEIANIEIVFNNNYLNNATDISIFSTTLHENVHATLIGLLNGGVITANSSDAQYSFLAEEWSKIEANKRSGGLGLSTSDFVFLQLEIISELVDEIKEATKTYGESLGYEINDIVYEALAWAGLDKTVAFTIEFDDEYIQDTINNLIDYEATGFDVLSEGKKCNEN